MQRPSPDQSLFPQTRWSLVQQAVAAGDPNALVSLSKLCETYYRPLLVVIRSKGFNATDAEDLRQRFFIQILKKETFAKALVKQEKLRSFLLMELKSFLGDHYRFIYAQKRDERKTTSFEDLSHGDAAQANLVDDFSPDAAYDLSWRKVLVTDGMKALATLWEAERETNQDLPAFSVLGPLMNDTAVESQARVAERLGVNLNTLKTHLGRLRKELKRLLSQQVAQTLVNPTEETVREELTALRLLK